MTFIIIIYDKIITFMINYNNKLYEIVLMGEEIKTIEFVNRLLETVNFNLN